METFDISLGPVTGIPDKGNLAGSRSSSAWEIPSAHSVDVMPGECRSATANADSAESVADSPYSDCAVSSTNSLRENKILGDAFVAIVKAFSGRTQSVKRPAVQPEAIIVENLKGPHAAKTETTVVEKTSTVHVVKPEAVVVEAPVREGADRTVVAEKPEVVADRTVRAPADRVVLAEVAAEARPEAVVASRSEAVVVEAPVRAPADRGVLAEVAVEARPEVVVAAKSAAVVVEAPVREGADRTVVVEKSESILSNPQPSTLNHQPSTLNHHPSTLTPHPSTVAHRKSDEAEEAVVAAQQVVVEMPVRVEQVQTVETSAQVAPVRGVPSVSASSPTEMVLAAAEAVADAIAVTPGERMGDGEVVVRLKPDVLDGSAVKIEVVGSKVSVSFAPATSAAAQVLSGHVGELEAHLAQTVPAYSYDIVVAASQTEAVSVNQMGAAAAQTAARAGSSAGVHNRKRT